MFTTKIKEKALILFSSLALSSFCFAQTSDTVKNTSFLAGSVAVTNNGISLVPSFSLDKPALAINMTAGKNRLSFDPELDFSLKGQPWQFLFWWRYKLLNSEKLKIRVGTHLALTFHNDSVLSDRMINRKLTANQNLVGELFPHYIVAKNFSMGLYYLYSRGLQSQGLQKGHYVSLISNLSNIKITDRFFSQITPQVYYLNLDSEYGYYLTSAFVIRKVNFPLYISSVVNKKLASNINGSKDFIWNVSLGYAFDNRYIKH
jgi:hypothetical protein